MEVKKLNNGMDILLVESQFSKYFIDKVFEQMDKGTSYMEAYDRVVKTLTYCINNLNYNHELARIQYEYETDSQG